MGDVHPTTNQTCNRREYDGENPAFNDCREASISDFMIAAREDTCIDDETSLQSSIICRGKASDFALITLYVYSMIWNEKMSGGVIRYVPSPIICVPTSRCFGFSRTQM